MGTIFAPYYAEIDLYKKIKIIVVLGQQVVLKSGSSGISFLIWDENGSNVGDILEILNSLDGKNNFTMENNKIYQYSHKDRQ